jgi:tetratricopeptide (TPR) repeat protein
MADKRVSKFPYSWSDATRVDWVDSVMEWFEDNYKREPQPAMARQTMSVLLDNIFEILRKSKGSDSSIRLLGSKLREFLTTSISRPYPHHHRIALLLERDIRSRHAHLFVLPQVSKAGLLNRPGYSALLLAAKLHASGEYNAARTTALDIGEGCSLAQYIIGQSERKLKLYDQAHLHLEKGIDILEQASCTCPFSEKATPICNALLLKAVMVRAQAVVWRLENESEESEEAYNLAETIAEQAMSDVASEQHPFEVNDDTLWIGDGKENAYRVVADVVADIYYSHGYYWYHKRNYDIAEIKFEKAIAALERAKEKWDSPYTRLAIVKFCKYQNFEEAKKLFVKAQSFCEETSIHVNREAPLSLALCTLGLKTIETIVSTRPLTSRDPLSDLELAIEPKPKLALGPLECHLNDAEHFAEVALPEAAQGLVNCFINRLRTEITRIKPEPEPRHSSSPNFTRILFLSADPSDAPRLQLGKEQRIIEEKLRLAKLRDKFEFYARTSVRSEDVSQALLDIKPQIVHFSGHGTTDGQLGLQDENDTLHPVTPEALASLFKLVADSVNCVILNACYTDLQAEAIAKYIDHVIGMKLEMLDKASIAFAIGFYQALGAGCPIIDAFEFGKAQMMMQNTPGADAPVLFKSKLGKN